MAAYDRGEPGPGPNIGALNTGRGSMVVGTAIGHQPQPAGPGRRPHPRADFGVITVLAQEMRAVVRLLQRARGYRTRQLFGGAQVHEADFPATSGVLRAVAMQALDRGPRSAVVAYHRLREQYAPPVVLLVGIAGGIGPAVAVGDVVLSDEVIYYDARREAAGGVHRRGQSHPIAPVLRHRLNEFFRVHGELVTAGTERFRIHRGPIGSGDAVVTDQDSDIRRWLREFHEKTLAVETEAGGIAQAFYEEVEQDQALRGWLTIRGISDQADAAKGHSYHDLAAGHAAAVLELLVPFLLLSAADA